MTSQSSLISKAILDDMLAVLAHRGPNHSDTCIHQQIGSSIGLGYCRLSIIDLSTAANQPMTNETGEIWVVYNGEIYNHDEIRQELISKGHRYISRSDTETIVHAYEEWGIDALNHFNGMFALAIHDKNTGELFLARDKRGIKPLYYSWDGNTLAFASELKALIRTGIVPSKLDPTALWLFLCLGYIPSPHCLINGVHKLRPGSFLRFHEGKLGHSRYDHNSTPPHKPVDRDEDKIAHIRQALENAVQRQLMSDVPVGIFLSGGLDSSILATLASRSLGKSLHTFSVAYSANLEAGRVNPKFNDDFAVAKQLSEELGSIHHEAVIENDDNLMELLTELVYQLDEPLVEPVFISTHFLSKLARQQSVPVILTGDGADELFGGYDRYNAARRLALYERVPGLKSILPAVQLIVPGTHFAEHALALQRLLNTQFASERYITFSRVFQPQEALELLSPDIAEMVDIEALPRLVEMSLGSEMAFVDQMAHADLTLWVGEHFNPRLDRVSMYHSVEARVPFQDDEVVEIALAIQMSHKRRQGEGKYLLKRAFTDILPESILNRPKRAFQAPAVAWLEGGLKEASKQLFQDNQNALRLFKPEQVFRLMDKSESKTSVQAQTIWALIIAKLWTRLYL